MGSSKPPGQSIRKGQTAPLDEGWTLLPDRLGRMGGGLRMSHEKVPGLLGRGPMVTKTGYFSAANAFAIRPIPATTVAFGSAV